VRTSHPTIRCPCIFAERQELARVPWYEAFRSLMDTIEHYLEPEILVHFVKQNLNKPYHVLELELDLRPNNNDMDVQLTKHTSTSATRNYILIHPVEPQVAIIQANQGDVALMHFLAKVPRKVQCFGL
jgi:hypothetical protein